MSTVSDSPNDSPYNSEEGVYDNLRYKISPKSEVDDTYQHASAVVSRDMYEYDTMANSVNKNKKKGSFMTIHIKKETNEHHGYDSRANNLLTGNPYDIAT